MINEIKVAYHPGQHRLFRKSKAKRRICRKGRRWGFTQGAAHDVIQTAIKGITPQLWVDTVSTNIDRYVERYFIPVLRQLPSHLWKWRQQKKELTILRGKIDLRSADRPELIEGFGYKKVTLNEAGIILKNKYLYYNAILPMLMDFDPVLTAGGTPKGGGGLFHELYTKANDPLEKGWEAFHFTSYDNPFIDPDVIDTMAGDMPELVRKQEIMAEFLESEALVFRNIDDCINERLQPLKSSTVRNYAGLDLAKHVDFTSLTILNEDKRQIYRGRWNQLDWGYQKQLILEKLERYNAGVLLDSTGVGDPIYDDLVGELGESNVTGYKFTSDTKKKLIENLMLAFEKRELELLADPVQTNELKIFTYEFSPSGRISYSAPDGSHDDTVISLALANWCVDNNKVRLPRFGVA